jgi:hypothetical protein
MNTNKKQQALRGCIFFFLAACGLCGALQAAEKGRDAGLVDVVSVYNGGYFWSKGDSDASNAMSLVNSVVGSRGYPSFLADKKNGRCLRLNGK